MFKNDMNRSSFRIAAAMIPLAGAIACGPPPRAIVVRTLPPAQAPVNPPAIVLSELPVDQVIIPTRPVSPLVVPSATLANKVSLTATNANVREVLPALAAAAGISLVMTPDVKGRISLYLRDVSPLDALRAVIDEAGLVVGENVIPLPYGPAVFFQLPVNVNTASALVLKARFGLSDSTANWLVRARSW